MINFYNKNGTFKSFSEILSNKNNLEHEIIDFIITSNAFLKQVDYERLTELEKFKLVKILNEGYENVKEATTLTPRKVPSKKIFNFDFSDIAFSHLGKRTSVLN